eukprot:m.147506 g.147506  ORF g.147506 m.147506 type:complete len:51 (-) comp30540_c3_seq2:2090-2242(-)
MCACVLACECTCTSLYVCMQVCACVRTRVIVYTFDEYAVRRYRETSTSKS